MNKRLSLLLLLGCSIFNFSKPATAQVTSDGTTNTTVDVSGNDFTIQQGDRAGGNLFHSFGDFSLPTGGSAFFNNAVDIVNIFSRVTGGNISNIDGLIRANGTANLFLLNPAGIIFGEGARLDIGGSFFGSTADSIIFPDGEFSASDLANPPLLTINAPIGLNLRDNPGDIVNRSVADDVGLQVPSGKNFSLIGGNINLEAGKITAPGGVVNLGGLSAAGTVTFNDNGSLSFPENVAKADVSLSNAATVDVRGTGGGSITINARNLNLKAGNSGSSFIRGGITADSNSSEAQAGEIKINATNNVTADESSILNQVDLEAVGNAGDITITTENLTLTNGGQVSASTGGRGNAGSVSITATDTIIIDGEDSSASPSAINSQVGQEAVGDAGDVTITTGYLNLTNGGEVAANTRGQGNAGSIKINATDTITIDGERSDFFPSSVSAQVGKDAVGDAGDVTITTDSLNLTNGGIVSASTTGQGNAGSVRIIAANTITIDGEEDLFGFPSAVDSQVISGAVGNAGGVIITTGKLTLSNGGRVSASVNGQGNAGDVNVNARESITIVGATENNLSGLFADAFISNGNGGNINVFTDELTIDDGGSIEASNFDSFGVFDPGTGEPGNINLQANSLSLTNGARIQASTQSETGNRANINLQIADNLTLSNNSFISARAINSANGGNIDIGAEFIIAFPNSNNDILASAQQGQGGNINITAEALFGIKERPQNPITNDIDASSEFGLDGSVSISTPDTNRIQTDIELPNNPIESERTVAQACQSNNIAEKTSGLTVKGRGGLPQTPTDPLNYDVILVDNQELSIPSNLQTQSPDIKPIKTSIGDIYPARGIIKTVDGKIILTSYPTDNINTRTPHNSANCAPL